MAFSTLNSIQSFMLSVSNVDNIYNISGNYITVVSGSNTYIVCISNCLLTNFINTNNTTVDYLCIGGGGGGGGSYGGGGGAGGIINGSFILHKTSYLFVKIGAGGKGYISTSSAKPTNGENTIVSGNSINTITAYGGGSGAGYVDNIAVSYAASSGYGVSGISGSGSGGGGGGQNNQKGIPIGLGGYAGGNGGGTPLNSGGGGGGGAGSIGSNNTGTGGSPFWSYGGAGGSGTNAYSTWLSVISSYMSNIPGWQTATSDGYIAGGGGGGTNLGSTTSPSIAIGGSGGGGSGSCNYKNAGVNSYTLTTTGITNTGSGGGASGGNYGGITISAQNGGNGGCGLVILVYTNS